MSVGRVRLFGSILRHGRMTLQTRLGASQIGVIPLQLRFGRFQFGLIPIQRRLIGRESIFAQIWPDLTCVSMAQWTSETTPETPARTGVVAVAPKTPVTLSVRAAGSRLRSTRDRTNQPPRQPK